MNMYTKIVDNGVDVTALLGAREALTDYIQEQDANHRLALGLDELVSMAEQELNTNPGKQ